MTRVVKANVWCLSIVGLLCITACSTTPTVYHTLTVNNANAPKAEALSHHIPSLGIGPVNLPTLLDREGLVIRKTPTSVAVSDTHLWGGQLEDELLDALTQQLRSRLPFTQVQTIPWELTQAPRYQLVLSVETFDGAPQGVARLQGTWQWQLAATGKMLSTEVVQLQRPVTGNTIDDVVVAQSLLVGDLVKQIITSLQQRFLSS